MRERSLRPRPSWCWPPYALATAVVLAVMGVGRATNATTAVLDIGRTEARQGGWYADRRPLQALVIGVIMVLWVAGLVAAAAWTRRRHRRYLHHFVGLSALVTFAAVRTVSLHQIDDLLHRHSIGGVRPVAWLEWALLAWVAVAAVRLSLLDEPRRVPADLSELRR